MTKDNGHSSVNNDELFQKIKPTVLHTAHLNSEKARDALVKHLKELYPQHYANVFVWSPNKGAYSSKRSLATARFDASDN